MIDENQVINTIQNLIEEIQSDGEPMLAEVFDYIPSQYTQYPAAYVVPVSWSEDIVDLRDTTVLSVFRVGVVYTLDPDAELAQKEVRSAAKKIREVLGKQENIQLGGSVDWSQLSSGTYTYDTNEQRVAIAQIDITVIKRYSRYTNQPN